MARKKLSQPNNAIQLAFILDQDEIKQSLCCFYIIRQIVSSEHYFSTLIATFSNLMLSSSFLYHTFCNELPYLTKNQLTMVFLLLTLLACTDNRNIFNLFLQKLSIGNKGMHLFQSFSSISTFFFIEKRQLNLIQI